MAIPALDLDKLTREEKLQLIDEIWDSLEANSDDLSLPDWHRRLLTQRLDEMDREGPTGVSWEEALQEIQSRFK